MRPLHLVLVVVLTLGCSSPATMLVPELDAGDVDASAASDAGGLDAGELDAAVPPLDAASDASTPLDARPPVDARPMPLDAPRGDAGPGYAGECWIVPQAGCGSGEACAMRRMGGALMAVCIPAGTLGTYGASCGAGRPDPAPGFECISNVIVAYCLVDGPAEQCPPIRGVEMRCEQRAPEAPFPVGLCAPVP
jgi:hypothetical protein